MHYACFVLFLEESEGSTVCDPSEAREGGGEGEGGEDDEPTQAYDLDSPRSDGEGAPMDIEPTVAYGNGIAMFVINTYDFCNHCRSARPRRR